MLYSLKPDDSNNGKNKIKIPRNTGILPIKKRYR
jgi:hypothetical protein